MARADSGWHDRSRRERLPERVLLVGADRTERDVPPVLRGTDRERTEAVVAVLPTDAADRTPTWRILLANPPVAALWRTPVAGLGWIAGPPAANWTLETAQTIASSADLEVSRVHVDLDRTIVRQGLAWTILAWLVTLGLLASVVAALLAPGIPTLLFALVAAPLAASFVLAHAGATLELRVAAIYEGLERHGGISEYGTVCLVVPSRYAPGLGDRFREDGVPVDVHYADGETT